MASFDVLIRGGVVVDGTGRPGRAADVGIVGERISAIGKLGRAASECVVDAAGCVVAPGFIDIHHHADGEMRGGVRGNPMADNMLRQGVTTLVGGNCGGGPVPMGPHLDAVSKLEIRQNYACLAGVGSGFNAALRSLRVKSWTERARRAFTRQLAEDLENGAIGYSSGLVYSTHVTTDMVIDGARVAARYGSFYVSHIRNEGDHLLGAIEELVFICRTANLPGQVSHAKCYGRRNWGKAAAALELIERANRQGLDITADQYPYTGCYSGLLGHVLPGWARQLCRGGDYSPLLRRSVVADVRRDMAKCLDLVGGADRIILCPHTPMPSLDGRRLADFLRGPEDLEGLIRLLKRARSRLSAIVLVMCEDDVETYMRHPLTMTGSDGQLRRFGEGFSHPRNYGTFPRVLARYVRDRQVIPLERAVQRATSMPARRLGFKERGVLAKGKIADIVVFDPRRIKDTATFRNGHSYPAGIPYVVLAGHVAVDRGRPAERGFGRVIRRGEG